MDWNDKRIIITSCGGLGDLIMFTPALRRLKELYPRCELVFMCRQNHLQVLERLPYIDKVICIQRGKAFGRFRVLPDYMEADAVIFTDWHPQLLPFTKIFDIPLVAGYPRVGHLLSKCITRPLSLHVFDTEAYAAETNARILSEALDVNLDGDMTRLDISLPKEEERRSVDAMLSDFGIPKDGSFLLLNPYTGFEQRNWTQEAAREFVRRAKLHWDIPVVVAAPKDKDAMAREISELVLAGCTTIMELTELVKRAAILVTPDSGPMHIAGAVGTDCVALFSKDLPSRWAPKSHCIPVTLSVECSPCDDSVAKICPHVRCMRGISEIPVLEACEKFLKKGVDSSL